MMDAATKAIVVAACAGTILLLLALCATVLSAMSRIGPRWLDDPLGFIGAWAFALAIPSMCIIGLIAFACYLWKGR